MADEGNERRIRRMDLNLYLGLPRSPRPRSLDLGSDLALSSLPRSISSTSEESHPHLEMSRALEPADSHAPYSPSHASITPDPNLPPIDLILPNDGNSNQGYNPYFASYDQFNPLYDPTVESEGPIDVLTPPLAADLLPTLQDTDEPMSSPIRHEPQASNLPSYIPLEPQETSEAPAVVPPLRFLSPYIPHLPSMLSYVPRSPSYSPPSPPYSPQSPSYAPTQAELMGGEDESSSRRDIFESSEFRFRRLIESSHRLRLRRFRSSLPYHGSERPNFGRSTSPGAEQLMRDIMSSQHSLETTGKHKLPEEGIPAESSEEEKEDKNKTAANFECNICMDMAQEPVVTSCGHLFCWPCLYQWLHIHSEHKECPLCKGEVTDANITPIYGRGVSEASDRKKLVQSGESNVKIPPRPRGNRFESLRQQFRPVSRRLGEGLATSWRRLVNPQMRSRNRFEGSNGDLGLPGILNGGQHAVLTRLRARRLLREELSADIGVDAEETRFPRDNTIVPQSSDNRADLWHQFSMYSLYATDRLAAISADIGRVVGNSNRRGASSSSVNPPLNPEQIIPRSTNVASTSATDQASVSSTTAIIQGDAGFPDGTAEPNSAGSSRSYRRRGRSSTSGSLDVDDGFLHARKRRRTN